MIFVTFIERLSMAEQILVLQHNEKAPIGVVGDELERLGATLKIRNLLNGDTIVSSDLNNSLGLVVLGGPIDAYDQAYVQQLRETVEIILHFHHRNSPILGICLGAQLIARAFRQPCRSNNGWETGFTQLSLTDAGRKDPLFCDFSELPKLFEFHEDGFYLPDEAELLINGEACTNQGFRMGTSSYGFQFHPEVTAEITRGWAKVLSDEGSEMDKSDLDNLIKPNPQAYLAQATFAHLLTRRWLALVREQVREQSDQSTIALASV